MAISETKYYCPVCGSSNLDENQGTLYCKKCQIFVGRTATFGDFSMRRSRATTVPAEPAYTITPISVDFLGTLVQSINGALLILGGIFLGSSAVVESAATPSPSFFRVIGLAVLMLFFGIVFWKLGTHLKHLEKGAWATLLVMNLLLLYIFGEPFIRSMMADGIKESFSAISDPRDLLPMLGFTYPSFVILFLFITLRHFK